MNRLALLRGFSFIFRAQSQEFGVRSSTFRRLFSGIPAKAGTTNARGYTLVEILVATTLSLMILGAVVQLFGTVGASISQSRSFLESSERLRAAQTRLQLDLEGLTVSPMPPVRSEGNKGYLEIVESPLVQGRLGTYMIDYTLTPDATYGFMLDSKPNNHIAVDTSKGNQWDTTVGDTDILMLTTRSTGKPFTGKYLLPDLNNPPNSRVVAVESDVAEVAYFVRGRDLHRRMLLVAPALPLYAQPNKAVSWVDNGAIGFFADNDISVHYYNDGAPRVAANTLADLTRRECRFAHPWRVNNIANRYDVREWSYLGLPTSKETSDLNFVAGNWDATRIAYDASKPNVMDNFFKNRSDLRFQISPNNYYYPRFDLWTNDKTARLSDSELINMDIATPGICQGNATGDDVILTNVIGFDIKVWDPGAPILQDNTPQHNFLYPGDPLYILPGHPQYNGSLAYTVIGFGAYVDLGYFPRYDPMGYAWAHPLPCPAAPLPLFHRYGNSLAGGPTLARVYDTWNFAYDNSGIAIDGFDNPDPPSFPNGRGIVDNDAEKPSSPPYPAPLRGIQIKIRIFEPDSRQIREVTIEQDFLPK